MHWTNTQKAVKTTLTQLGLGDAPPLGNRLLFRDRCFVGICFGFEGVSAIWLPAISQLKFVDDSGQLLKVLSLLDDEQDSSARQAA